MTCSRKHSQLAIKELPSALAVDSCVTATVLLTAEWPTVMLGNIVVVIAISAGTGAIEITVFSNSSIL